jgi:hypothetical protein
MSSNLAKLIGLTTLVFSIAAGSYAVNAAPKCYGQYGSNGVSAGYYCEK